MIDEDFRTWAEECDAIQGINVFVGADDAWGGFGAKYVQGLRDEFGLKSAIWIWGLEEGFGKNVCWVVFSNMADYGDYDLAVVADRWEQGTKAKQMQRKATSARSLYSLSEHASMYIPLSFPTSPSSSLPKSICGQLFDRESLWHTSALLATVMESISLPSRLYQFGENGNGSSAGFLSNIEAVLNGNGNQKISSVQMSIADPATLQTREEKEISNLGVRCGNSDDRMRMQDRSNKESDYLATNAHAGKLDINFLPPWSDKLPRRASYPHRDHSSPRIDLYDHEKSREHIFGQVETLRGLGIGYIGGHDKADQQETIFDNRTNRMQRRLAALPNLEKYVLFLTVFPIPLLLRTSRSALCLYVAWCLCVCASRSSPCVAYVCTSEIPPGQGVAPLLQQSG